MKKLLDVLQRLVDLGNTVVVIEHHLDVIKTADWIIDLGPEGGEQGGRIVASGTPEQVLRSRKSYTAQALKKVLSKRETRVSKYDQKPLDLGGLNTVPIRQRGGKVRVEHFAKPYRKGAGVAELIGSLPATLAADDFRALVSALRTARERRRASHLGDGRARDQVRVGSHSDRSDEARLCHGICDERVDGDPRFRDRDFRRYQRKMSRLSCPMAALGSAEETGREMNDAYAEGSHDGLGAGEALGRKLDKIADPQFRGQSLLLAAWRASTPVTVHIAIGTDTPHTHPHVSPGALGEATHRDFRLFCSLGTTT